MNALNRKENNPNPSRRRHGWFPSRRRRHDPREARPEGSQFHGNGWIAQLVHRLGLAPAHHSARTGCRRKRFGDPWLVFNISTFTFDGQPRSGFNRFVSHENTWR